MSNFHQLHTALIDMDRVRLIRPILAEHGNNYIHVIYHDGSEDSIDCEEPEKAIRELLEYIRGEAKIKVIHPPTIDPATYTYTAND